MPVEYFNPLQNVEIDPSVNMEELQHVGHSMGELVGLALRNLAECPVELNLVPLRVRESQKLEQKKPFFIATVAAVVIGFLALGWFYTNKVVTPKQRQLAEIQNKIAELEGPASELSSAQSQVSTIQDKMGELGKWVDERFFWYDILDQLQTAASETEKEIAEALSNKEREVQAGLWIDQFLPEMPDLETEMEDPNNPSSGGTRVVRSMSMRNDPRMARRYAALQQAATPKEEEVKVNTNEIRQIRIVCKGVNLNLADSRANDMLMYAFERRVKEMTNLFDMEGTSLIKQDALTNRFQNSFTFDMNLKFKTPVKI